MKSRLISFFCLIFSLLLFSDISNGQNNKKPTLNRILFIFDGSNSMNAKWENNKTKVEIARSMLINMVDSIEKVPNIEMALRIYGHQSPVPPQDCNDTKLEVPFRSNNAEAIRQKLYALYPKGTTPIARSLELCAKDFPECSNCRNVIILITDGIEACEGDPCAMALALQKKGITLKPFVIGVGLDIETIEAFKCVGHIYNATSSHKFREVLDIVITKATGYTTAQINLLDINKRPTETNVNMTFYNSQTGKMINNYIHTLNFKGNPDTLILSPETIYDIEVHTIPQVKIEDVKLKIGKHNIIKTDAPQGKLEISENRGTKLKDINCIIRESGNPTTINVQNMDKTERYLVGNYDIEILTLPRIIFRDIKINQSKTTIFRIAEPGVTTVIMPAAGYASLHVKNNKKYKWVVNLNHSKKRILTLQPGKYMIVYRPDKATYMQATKIKYFEVLSGRTNIVQF